MIIGLKMSSVLQLYLREKVLKVFETNPNDIDFINDLPLKDTCTWNTVLDEGISKGCVNWQLYGSKKPANQAYKLTGVYHITMDDADNEFCSSSLDVSEYDNSFENFCKLSIRYRDHPEYKLQPGMEGVLQERSGKNKQAKKGGRVLKSVPSGNLKVISRASSNSNVVDPTSLTPMENIQTKEELDIWCSYLETTLQESSKDYKISEIHEYAKILPERFYGPGSYNEWIRLGFALKNTSEMLFITWMVVSAKQPGFDYSRIPEFYTTWARIERKTDGNVLTSKSIIYWAKEYNYEEYMNVKQKTLSYFVTISVENPDDREIAQVLYNLASERFVCATLTNTTHTLSLIHI